MSSIACVVMLLSIGAAPAQSCECLPPSPDINPKMQALFEEILGNWVRNETSEDEFKKKVAALQEQAARTSRDPDNALMEQFFAKFFAEAPTFTNEERPMGMIVILYVLQPTRMAFLSALHPYLCLKNQKLSEFGRDFMARTYTLTPAGRIDWTPGGQIDLTPHKKIIEDAIHSGQPAPVGLVRDMFEAHPCHALVALSEVEPELERARKTLGWDDPVSVCSREKLVDLDVAPSFSDALASLSESPKWWVRLWVVEFLRQVPALRTESVWNSLQEDRCGVVRERTKAPRNSPLPPPTYLHQDETPGEE